MNQADKDAQKWMEMNQKAQYRNLIRAKESGQLHYINQHGDVVMYEPEEAKKLLINIANALEGKDESEKL